MNVKFAVYEPVGGICNSQSEQPVQTSIGIKAERSASSLTLEGSRFRTYCRRLYKVSFRDVEIGEFDAKALVWDCAGLTLLSGEMTT